MACRQTRNQNGFLFKKDCQAILRTKMCVCVCVCHLIISFCNCYIIYFLWIGQNGGKTETAPPPDETLVAGRILLAAIRFIMESNQTRLLNTPANGTQAFHSASSLHAKFFGCVCKYGMIEKVHHLCGSFLMGNMIIKYQNSKCANFRQTHFQTPKNAESIAGLAGPLRQRVSATQAKRFLHRAPGVNMAHHSINSCHLLIEF